MINKKAREAVNAAQRGLNVEIPQCERLVPPYLTEHQAAALRIQLAAAPPFQQGSIMREQAKRSVVAVFQSMIDAVVENFMRQTYPSILAILQDEYAVVYKTVGAAIEVVKREG